MTEQWKFIPEGIGSFHRKQAQVSDWGRVRWLWTGKHSSFYRYYKPHSYYGQLCITDDIIPHMQVRKLVMLAFVGEPKPNTNIIHLDGDHHNCHLVNLQYADKEVQTRKHLTANDKETIRSHWHSAKKNGLPLTAEVLAAGWGISPRTVYRIIRE